jgi:hypothetical protein
MTHKPEHCWSKPEDCRDYLSHIRNKGLQALREGKPRKSAMKPKGRAKASTSLTLKYSDANCTACVALWAANGGVRKGICRTCAGGATLDLPVLYPIAETIKAIMAGVDAPDEVDFQVEVGNFRPGSTRYA